MKKNIFKLLIVLVALFVIQIGLLFVIPKSIDEDQGVNEVEEILAQHNAYFSTESFYKEAYFQGLNQVKEPEEKIYGGIIPHHLIVKDKIAAFFQGIEKYDYDTIVLVGPNHFERGSENILLSRAKWLTPYGELIPDKDLIGNLVQSGYIIEENPFIAEHSISGLVGFIKKSFPKAKIVPIILKNKTTEKEVKDLSNLINQNVNKEKTLVLASVDFSHFQPAIVADFHDKKSNSVIQSFDFSRVYDLEIDSPASIYTLLEYLRLNKIQASELIFSTNSNRLVGKLDDPGTSHNLIYFSKGGPKNEKLINFMFFGDMMLDRNVEAVIEQKGLEYIFSDLAGEEDRFFQGVDFIGANLEGTVTNEGKYYAPVKEYNDFAFKPEIVKELKKYNFNFFNLANNHITDQGQQGTDETRVNLEEMGFGYVGCGDMCLSEYSSKIIKVADRNIGMIGVSSIYTQVDLNKLDKMVKDLEDQTDYIIVNMHWGTEFTHYYNQRQQNIAYSLIDSGVDIVLGHHPHVVQGVEVYKNKPIFYSLGNFIFDQYYSDASQEGIAVGLSVNFELDQVDVKIFPFNSNENRIYLMKQKGIEEFKQRLLKYSDETFKELIYNMF